MSRLRWFLAGLLTGVLVHEAIEVIRIAGERDLARNPQRYGA